MTLTTKTSGEDVIMELMNEDVEAANEAADEYAENRRRISEKITKDWKKQVARWVVNDQ